jgi:hypothetical protein
MNLEFSQQDLKKKTQMSDFMKTCPVGDDFLCGQTDIYDEGNTRFLQFFESP